MHFQPGVCPAPLVELAGYAAGDVGRHYHPSIFDAGADRSRRVFVSGNLWGIGGGFYQNWLIGSAYYLNEFVPPARSVRSGAGRGEGVGQDRPDQVFR